MSNPFNNLNTLEILKAMNSPETASDGLGWATAGSRSLAQDPAEIYERRERRARLTARLYGGTKQDHINAQYR